MTGVSSWHGETIAAERFAGSADRVERVGLGARLRQCVAGLIKLDDHFAGTFELAKEAASVACYPFDSPASRRVARVLVSERDGGLVSGGVRREAFVREHCGGMGVNDGDRDRVPIGVDTNDVIDEFCQHGEEHLQLERICRRRPGRNRYARTVMSHTLIGWTGF